MNVNQVSYLRIVFYLYFDLLHTMNKRVVSLYSLFCYSAPKQIPLFYACSMAIMGHTIKMLYFQNAYTVHMFYFQNAYNGGFDAMVQLAWQKEIKSSV